MHTHYCFDCDVSIGEYECVSDEDHDGGLCEECNIRELTRELLDALGDRA